MGNLRSPEPQLSRRVRKLRFNPPESLLRRLSPISRNRNIGDEVLRVIASSPEWLKSYSVKKNLVENPKTPVTLAQRPC